MPRLIKHIDQIAREKQRDVLYLEFHPGDLWGCNYDFQNDPVRQKVLDDLTQMGVIWDSCAEFTNEDCMVRYAGQVYLDTPFDAELPLYQTLEKYLEHPDGSMRFEQVRFYVVPLRAAMKNAHHDEPGFWEKWAKEW